MGKIERTVQMNRLIQKNEWAIAQEKGAAVHFGNRFFPENRESKARVEERPERERPSRGRTASILLTLSFFRSRSFALVRFVLPRVFSLVVVVWREERKSLCEGASHTTSNSLAHPTRREEKSSWFRID